LENLAKCPNFISGGERGASDGLDPALHAGVRGFGRETPKAAAIL